MGQICNSRNWTPEAFWRCTSHEFMSIVEAQERQNDNAR